MHIIDISGAVATIRKRETLTKGRVGAEVTFLFDDDWTGLTKMAVFHQGDVTKDYVINYNKAIIPWECLESVGLPVEIGVYGIGSGGDIIIPTIWARTKEVQEGADPSGDKSLDHTLEVWAQILMLMGDLAELETENKDTLVAAINEVLNTTQAQIGDLEELDTEAKENLVAAVNEVAGKILALNDAIKAAKETIGSLDELETTAKSSIVAATNEVVRSVAKLNERLGNVQDSIGDLNGLNTKAKNNLVAAINEILNEQQNPLPGGGKAGQILTLNKAGEAEWTDAPDELPAGGKAGQILTVDSEGNPTWSDAPEGGSIIPDNGSVGQVLTKTSAGYGWADLPVTEVEDELPEGGNSGQVLTKAADGSVVWADVPEQEIEDEIPTNGTAGQVLTKTANGYGWADIPEPEIEDELPKGGSEGQVLMRTASGGTEWGDIDTDPFVTVHVTGDSDGGYTADKTAAELVAAHKNGEVLRCLVNGDCEASLIWVDDDATIPAVWFAVNNGADVITVVIGTPTCTVRITNLQSKSEIGDLSNLKTKDTTTIVAAVNEVKDDAVAFAITATDSLSFTSGGGFGSLSTEVFSVDKTVAEINEALAAGRKIVFVYTDADAEWKIPMVRQLATLASADGVLYFYSMIHEQYVVAAEIRNKDGAAQATVTTGPLSVLPWGGADGQFLSLVDGSPTWINSGADGVSATHSWDGTVLTITSASGTSSADLKGPQGPAGADGKTPVKGTDYYTDAEKQELLDELAEQAGSGGAGVMYVNLLWTDPLTTDKTVDEIIEAFNAGYAVFLLYGNDSFRMIVPLATIDITNKVANFVLTSVGDDKEAFSFGVSVTESGAEISDVGTSPELPAGGTTGQVLTIGSDGSPVWADPVATSAEGVLFG